MSSSKVVIYSSRFCPYCIRARRLLKRKGVTYEEIPVDLDCKRRVEMERLSGRHTVPQIFIGDLHIGGYDEMATLDRQGRLESLLGGPESDLS
jgi:glutaredoxin 3